ncbi:MAG: rhomboid family intramembrane serine protease [Burkholderiales bacterium]|nr:rhomboid family intramembrane serine protease [Burkholderiales bacterium]MDE1929037.1 rhomboid family intramembrane serine protease [Burkholderiales bacterium]MDE2160685.1 rhomboid family intramembrane serine protease [Burkholderiales bacterium]MDE2502334.1 rhomboid family intramembrane serine protease [Burkholderiales bacterium]
MPQIPPQTRNLIIACVALFLLQQIHPAIDEFLLRWFALWPLQSGNFMPWQVLSYAFLHGGIPHLLFNMLGLWMFGSDLESYWGGRRYLQYIAVCTLAAAAAQLLITPLLGVVEPTIGISGAIYGLLLAYALAFPRRQFDLVGFLPMVLLMIPSQLLNLAGVILYVTMLTNRAAVPIPPLPVKSLTMVAIFGAIELYQGLFMTAGGIAHFAHLGGMLGGWLLFLYWRNSGTRRRR